MKTIELNEADYFTISQDKFKFLMELMSEYSSSFQTVEKCKIVGEHFAEHPLINRFIGAKVKQLDAVRRGTSSTYSPFSTTVTSILETVHSQLSPWTNLPDSELVSHLVSYKKRFVFQPGTLQIKIGSEFLFENNPIKINKYFSKYFYKIVRSFLVNRVPYYVKIDYTYEELPDKKRFLVKAEVTLLPYSPVMSEELHEVLLDELPKYWEKANINRAKILHWEKANINRAKILQKSINLYSEDVLNFVLSDAKRKKIPGNVPAVSSTLELSRLISYISTGNSTQASGNFGVMLSSLTAEQEWEQMKIEISKGNLDFLNQENIEAFIEMVSTPMISYIYFQEPLQIANTLSRRSLYVTSPVIEPARKDEIDSVDDE